MASKKRPREEPNASVSNATFSYSDSESSEDEDLSVISDWVLPEASKKKKKNGKSICSSSEKKGKEEVIDVSFDFDDPKEDDFHPVRMLLSNHNSVFTSLKLDVASAAADAIVGQVEAGTMLKTSDGVMAFISVINMHTHKDNTFVQAVKRLLVKKCPSKQLNALEDLFNNDSQPLGLLVTERVLNLPLQLVPTLHNMLADDLAWAVKEAQPKSVRKSFEFKNFIHLSICGLSNDKPYFDEVYFNVSGGGHSASDGNLPMTFRFGIANRTSKVSSGAKRQKSNGSQRAGFKKAVEGIQSLVGS